MLNDLSILIPARNEMFLRKTIENILENIGGNTEIIVVCDGNWPNPPIEDNSRVSLIYHSKPIGQRAATNEAAKLSKAEFIMKCDAHCAFDKDFDVKMIADCEYDWTVVPKMYNLHGFNWKCKKCGDERYQGPTPVSCPKCDNKTEFERIILWTPRLNRETKFYRFDKDLKFQYWGNFGKRPEASPDLAPTMSLLGACWMMHRQRYWDLDGLDERHGSWGQMGTEIACKSWLSGGKLLVNKKTWFAHMFRTQGGDFGFPYPNPGANRARKYSRELWLNNKWPKAKYPLSWLITKFSPVPDWEEPTIVHTSPIEEKVIPPIKNLEPTKGLIYYTDWPHGTISETLWKACQAQLLRCMKIHNFPIVSVSQGPIDFGHNVVMDLDRSVLSIYRQIVRGLEESDADIVFLVEHDMLYHPSHFTFTPPRKDRFYYDRNLWRVCADTGKAVFYQTNCASMICVYRDLLLKHYTKARDFTEKYGFKHSLGFSPPKGVPKDERLGKYDTYFSPTPTIDIRHSGALTKRRMTKAEFRSERSCRDWTEADGVPGWDTSLGRFNEFLANLGNE